MSVHELKDRQIKRIPRAEVPKYVETNGIKRHELSLLELLIEAHPERAKIIIERLRAKAA